MKTGKVRDEWMKSHVKFQDNLLNSLRQKEVQSQTLGHQTATDKGKPRTYR